MAKGQQRDLKREAFWRGALARFDSSGMTVRGFCARERLTEPSFYSWRRVIRDRDAEQERTGLTFVPVTMQGDRTDHGDADIVIELRGGRILRLPLALPVRQVAELVHAIEAAPAPAPGFAVAETRL